MDRTDVSRTSLCTCRSRQYPQTPLVTAHENHLVELSLGGLSIITCVSSLDADSGRRACWRIFRASGRHEASASRYIPDINRRSNEIDSRYHTEHCAPMAGFAAAFVFARASDTRRRLIADRYQAHGEDVSIRNAFLVCARCVSQIRYLPVQGTSVSTTDLSFEGLNK